MLLSDLYLSDRVCVSCASRVRAAPAVRGSFVSGLALGAATPLHSTPSFQSLLLVTLRTQQAMIAANALHGFIVAYICRGCSAVATVN